MGECLVTASAEQEETCKRYQFSRLPVGSKVVCSDCYVMLMLCPGDFELRIEVMSQDDSRYIYEECIWSSRFGPARRGSSLYIMHAGVYSLRSPIQVKKSLLC